MIIAIDGPAGSGKGTIAKLIAEKLDLVYIDTGAMYRCLALKTIENKLKPKDKDKIIALSKKIEIKFDETGKVYLDGVDVTKEIRSKKVTNTVSETSLIVEVREEMVHQQRKMAEGLNVIMEGRDITTVVFPNADYQFYLDASTEERARRRYLQNKELGIEMSYEEIKENIEKRDYNDMHKEVGSLMRTDKQYYIDSTDMTIDEVVTVILKKIGEK